MRWNWYVLPSRLSNSTLTAAALMVIPRSRSRSIESSTCARMSRDSTVCVISRMRSASVDFPWSMWAMIEKLRMRDWSAMGRCKGRAEASLGPESEQATEERQPACREARDLLGLPDAQPQHGAGVDDRTEGQAAAHRDHLTENRAAEDLIEQRPRDPADRAEDRRRAAHAEHGAAGLPALEPAVELLPRAARLQSHHHRAGHGRPDHRTGD